MTEDLILDNEQIAQEILSVLKRSKQRGIQPRTGLPYIIGWYRGKRLFIRSSRGSPRNIERSAKVLRSILAPKGYKNTDSIGHDQFFDLACRVDELIGKYINPYGIW